jgi:hypothetical protein
MYGRKVTTAESELRTVWTDTTPSAAALDRTEHCMPRYNVPPLYVIFWSTAVDSPYVMVLAEKQFEITAVGMLLSTVPDSVCELMFTVTRPAS